MVRVVLKFGQVLILAVVLQSEGSLLLHYEMHHHSVTVDSR